MCYELAGIKFTDILKNGIYFVHFSLCLRAMFYVQIFNMLLFSNNLKHECFNLRLTLLELAAGPHVNASFGI